MPERIRSHDQSVVTRPAIYVPEDFPFDGRQVLPLDDLGFPGLVLTHNVSEVHIPPIGHERSQARYLIDYYHGINRVLVSHLGPNSHSSRHYHKPPITEYYWLLAGEAHVGERLIPKEGLAINPGEVHQVITGQSDSLLLIFMVNARLVREDRQHVYCEFENGTWVKVCDPVNLPLGSI